MAQNLWRHSRKALTRSPGMWCHADRQLAMGPPERPSDLVVMDSGVWVGRAVCPSSGAVPQLSCAQGGRVPWLFLVSTPCSLQVALSGAAPCVCTPYCLPQRGRSCTDHIAAFPFPAWGLPFRSISSSQELQALWRAEAGVGALEINAKHLLPRLLPL